MGLIDDVMPRYDVHELHSIACTRSLDEVLAARIGADPIATLLLRLRGLRPPGSIGELFTRMRFVELARDEHEIVVCMAGTPWRRQGGLVAFADAGPGTVRMVVNFRADGERVSTETRVEAMSPEAQRPFLRYWRVVGPFSALIRRRWLKQIAA